MRPLGRPVAATGQRACEVRSGGRSAVGECTRPSRAGASSIPGCPQPRGRTEHCPQIARRCRTIRSAIRILPAWRTVTHRAGGSSAVWAPRCCCSASAHPRRRPTRSGPRSAAGRWPASPAVLRGFDPPTDALRAGPPRGRPGRPGRRAGAGQRGGHRRLRRIRGRPRSGQHRSRIAPHHLRAGGRRRSSSVSGSRRVSRSAGWGRAVTAARGACTGDCVRARRIWTR